MRRSVQLAVVRARLPGLARARALSSSSEWAAESVPSSSSDSAPAFLDAAAAAPEATAAAFASDDNSSAIVPAAAPPEAAADTAVAAAELGSWPPDLALHGVDSLHTVFDLPWWGAIAGLTVLTRIFLLPFALQGSRQQATMQAIRGELAPLQARVQASSGQDLAAGQAMQDLYDKHGISPMRMLTLPFAQLPIFMSFFIGLRRLAESFPDAHTGGLAWFVDLGATDPIFVLPLASGISAFGLVRLSMPTPTAAMGHAEAENMLRMRMIISGVTLVSIPVACTMPASVLVYWLTNNAFSLAYTASLRAPALRAVVGLPPLDDGGGPYVPPPPGSTPPPAEAPYVASGGPTLGEAQVLATNSLTSLASSLSAAGKHRDAVAMQERALALCEDVLGEVHASSRDVRWRLAELHEAAGDLPAAIDAVAAWERAGGEAAEAARRTEELREAARQGGAPGDGE